jgi:hypothetical protein
MHVKHTTRGIKHVATTVEKIPSKSTQSTGEVEGMMTRFEGKSSAGKDKGGRHEIEENEEVWSAIQ